MREKSEGQHVSKRKTREERDSGKSRQQGVFPAKKGAMAYSPNQERRGGNGEWIEALITRMSRVCRTREQGTQVDRHSAVRSKVALPEKRWG